MSHAYADGHPIAYTALQPGTPVQTRDGQEFATVQAVLVDEKVAVFDGIVVETEQGTGSSTPIRSGRSTPPTS